MDNLQRLWTNTKNIHGNSVYVLSPVDVPNESCQEDLLYDLFVEAVFMAYGH